jgi:hypothetical protein
MRQMLLCAVWLCICATSVAKPIVFSYEGNATGTLDGVPFSNLPYRITGWGDTSSRTVISLPAIPQILWGWRIPHQSASILLGHLGEFAFITHTQTGVDFNGGLALGRDVESSLALGFVRDPLLVNWDMLSSIGPILDDGDLLQWDRVPVYTERGVLDMDGSIVTFKATIVPEANSAMIALVFTMTLSLTNRRRLAVP